MYLLSETKSKVQRENKKITVWVSKREGKRKKEKLEQKCIIIVNTAVFPATATKQPVCHSQDMYACSWLCNASETSQRTIPLVVKPSFSFLRQSGQYHFALLPGRSVRSTHPRWNHSFSHYGLSVNMLWLDRKRKGKLTSLLSQPIMVP